jgi:hypothetical protein
VGDLTADTAVDGADGAYSARLSNEWEIWGPNGGYVASVAMRAGAAASRLARPASVTCHFLSGAKFGPVDLAVAHLRQAKRAESLRVTMTQEQRPVLEALVWMIDGVDAPVATDGLIGGAASVWSSSRRLLASGGEQMLCRRIAGQ